MKITEIFKESDGSWSWGRMASSFTTGSAIWAFISVVHHSHTIPDPATLAGLVAYAVGPYATNKAATAFAKTGNQL